MGIWFPFLENMQPSHILDNIQRSYLHVQRHTHTHKHLYKMVNVKFLEANCSLENIIYTYWTTLTLTPTRTGCSIWLWIGSWMAGIRMKRQFKCARMFHYCHMWVGVIVFSLPLSVFFSFIHPFTWRVCVCTFVIPFPSTTFNSSASVMVPLLLLSSCSIKAFLHYSQCLTNKFASSSST